MGEINEFKKSAPIISRKLTDREIERVIRVVRGIISRNDFSVSSDASAEFSDLVDCDSHGAVYEKMRSYTIKNYSGIHEPEYIKDMGVVDVLPWKKIEGSPIGFHSTAMGFFDQHGNPLANFYLLRGHEICPILNYSKPKKAVLGEYLYGGIYFRNFGHFLLETLARMHHIKSCRLPVILISNGLNFDFKGWQRELLNLMDVDPDRFIFLNEPSRIESLHDCNPGFELRNFFLPSLRKAIVIGGGFLGDRKKVWISRSKLPSSLSKIEGEIEIELLLKNKGWHIFHPEEYSIKDQIECYSAASIVAGFEGSALHLIMLVESPEFKLIIFRRAEGNGLKSLNENYRVIGDRLGIVQRVYNVEMHYLSGEKRKRSFRLVRPKDVVDILDEIY